MLSLVGKLAALYAQSNSDSVVLQSVNDIETLTNGISRKIWQKIMILDNDLKPEPELLQSTLSTDLSVESSTDAAPPAVAPADAFVAEKVSSGKNRLPISEPGR
jgi:hypothetical protein